MRHLDNSFKTVNCELSLIVFIYYTTKYPIPKAVCETSQAAFFISGKNGNFALETQLGDMRDSLSKFEMIAIAKHFTLRTTEYRSR